MNFIDEAVVEFSSGNGGSGAVSFHREKHVPRGGPNGADGGRGGDVILVAERGKRTLFDFRLNPKYQASHGEHAVGNKRGKNGHDVLLKVPVGTTVTDTVLDEVLVDLNLHGMTYVLCKGGRGGFGNLHYTSSVRQAPNFAQKGEPGETILAKLELKLLADVGLIGLPNAGKSTLLSQISAAKPKIADYPFTTIVPNLGVVRAGDDTFVVADMPGLIEGASRGIGLGQQFLKHVERTKMLVHLVDVYPIDESDPIKNFETVENELKLYSADVAARPRFIALNKIDLIDAATLDDMKGQFEKYEMPVYAISGATGIGVNELVFAVHAVVKEAESQPEPMVYFPAKAHAPDESWDVVRDEHGYGLVGRKLKRMVAMTDLNNRDAVRFLHRRLERMGVIEKLRELGAEEGDSVHIDDILFTFTDLA